MKIKDIINMDGKYSAYDVGEMDITKHILDKLPQDKKCEKCMSSNQRIACDCDGYNECLTEIRQLLGDRK